MLEKPLTSAQVREKLIDYNRHVVIAHQPDASGVCPICRIRDCDPLRRARDYLATRDPGTPTDQGPTTEVEQLRVELAALETALRNVRRELFDCKARLSLIAQVVHDPTRARRAPGVTFGAVLAALRSGADTAAPDR